MPTVQLDSDTELDFAPGGDRGGVRVRGEERGDCGPGRGTGASAGASSASVGLRRRRGRKPKSNPTNELPDPPPLDPGAGTPAPSPAKRQRKSRPGGPYISWDAGDRKVAMAAAVSARLAGEDPAAAAWAVAPGTVIPRSTLDHRLRVEQRRREAAAAAAARGEEYVDPVQKKMLTSKAFREELRARVRARAVAGRPITRKEVLGLLQSYCGVERKKADNHYNYLVKNGVLPSLGGGSQRKAAPVEHAVAKPAQEPHPSSEVGAEPQEGRDHAATKGQKRGVYSSWRKGERKAAMDAAVTAQLLGKDPTAAAQKVVPGIHIPRTTLKCQVQAEKERRRAAAGVSDDMVIIPKAGAQRTVALAHDNDGDGDDKKAGPRSLTSEQFRKDLRRTIRARERAGNGMTCAEALQTIVICYDVSQKAASNHYNYLVKTKRLPRLERGARVAPSGAGARGSYRNWKTGEHRAAMDAAVRAHAEGRDPQAAAREALPGIVVPRTTLLSWVQAEQRREEAAAGSNGKDLDDATGNGGDHRRGRKLLTTSEFRRELEQEILSRDQHGDRMTRLEVLHAIMNTYGATKKAADNHYNYLIKRQMLPRLGGDRDAESHKHSFQYYEEF
ncbi:hypothetical protein ACHAWF_002283 [Thalassiosira exigua]